MTREEALNRLRPLESKLRSQGVDALYLFGSTARNEGRVDSDLDLMCELDGTRPLSLFDIARIQINLEDEFGRKVDLVERDALRPRVRKRVEADSIRVF